MSLRSKEPFYNQIVRNTEHTAIKVCKVKTVRTLLAYTSFDQVYAQPIQL